MSQWQEDDQIVNASSSGSEDGSNEGISLPIPSQDPQSPLRVPTKTPVSSHAAAQPPSTTTSSSSKKPIGGGGSASPPPPPSTSSNNNKGNLEAEVAKMLLGQEVTKAVFRYDLHLTSIINLYLNSESERQLVFDASVVKVHGESIVPFNSAAEEKSAGLRFERLLGSANRMYEVELTSFKNKNKELRADWQVKFSKIVEDCRAKEERRETELLNAKAFCRREVDATIQRMKATYADIDSANTATKDLRETTEFLQGECKRLREALSESRRQSEEDRTRHFTEREKIIDDYSSILKAEREKMSEKMKQVHEVLEGERTAHFKEIASKAQFQTASGASLQAELSQALQRCEYLTGEASTVRGELAAERKQFSEERLSLSRYIEELEVAVIEMGGKPENIKAHRSAQLYLDNTKARSASIKNRPAPLSSTPLASARGGGATGMEHLSPLSVSSPNAQSIVDAMLGSRVSQQQQRYAADPYRNASLYSQEEEETRNEASRIGVIQTVRRSPSAEMGLGYNSPYIRTMNRSNSGAAIDGASPQRVEAPYRGVGLSPRSLGAAERARTLNNRGGTIEAPRQRSWH